MPPLAHSMFPPIATFASVTFQALSAQVLHHADITSRDDVLRMGIDKYNDECRSIVMRRAWDSSRCYQWLYIFVS